MLLTSSHLSSLALPFISLTSLYLIYSFVQLLDCVAHSLVEILMHLLERADKKLLNLDWDQESTVGLQHRFLEVLPLFALVDVHIIILERLFLLNANEILV